MGGGYAGFSCNFADIVLNLEFTNDSQSVSSKSDKSQSYNQKVFDNFGQAFHDSIKGIFAIRLHPQVLIKMNKFYVGPGLIISHNACKFKEKDFGLTIITEQLGQKDNQLNFWSFGLSLEAGYRFNDNFVLFGRVEYMIPTTIKQKESNGKSSDAKGWSKFSDIRAYVGIKAQYKPSDRFFVGLQAFIGYNRTKVAMNKELIGAVDEKFIARQMFDPNKLKEMKNNIDSYAKLLDQAEKTLNTKKVGTEKDNALQALALCRQTLNDIQDGFNQLMADGVDKSDIAKSLPSINEQLLHIKSDVAVMVGQEEFAAIMSKLQSEQVKTATGGV